MDLKQQGRVGKRNLFVEYGGDKEMVARVSAGIVKAVDASFRTCPMRNVTDAEMKRRLDYCTDLSLELRFASHWSTFQIADRLTQAIEIWLKSGKDFTPDTREFTRTVWAKPTAA
jgi:hypothetical protein